MSEQGLIKITQPRENYTAGSQLTKFYEVSR